MNHAELLCEVILRADRHHVWYWPTPPSTPRMKPGWPDITLCGSRGHIIAELKSQDGRRTLAQIDCANHLVRAGLVYRLWRPSDLEDGTIDQALKEIR